MAQKRFEDSFAKRSLGQNFLVDRGVIQKLVDAFDPTKDDVVLEIGPGRGALTEELIERAREVFALEFDRNLAEIIRQKFSARKNFTLIEDDALHIDLAAIAGVDQPLRLIANLPYNISTAILQRLFTYPDVFSDCVLMFQREVAERITALPGTKDRGFLTVLTELHFEVERLFDVSPDAFRPVPKVWSSVVRMIPKKEPIVNEQVFRDLVGTAFTHKRKTMLNNLKARYPNAQTALTLSDIEVKRRAETLTLEEWLRLSECIEQTN